MHIKGLHGIHVGIAVQNSESTCSITREYQVPNEHSLRQKLAKNPWKEYMARPYHHQVKYIEAKPGAHFQINVYKLANTFRRAIGFTLSLDGHTMPMVHEPPESMCQPWNVVLDSGVAGDDVNGYDRCMFKFDDLNIGEFV